MLSGGNVDPLLLMRVIRHGLAAAGRYLYFRARIPDVPGGLARLLDELAERRGQRPRRGARAHLGAACTSTRSRSQLQVETRGPEHAERVLAHLRGCGYTSLASSAQYGERSAGVGHRVDDLDLELLAVGRRRRRRCRPSCGR